MTKPELDIEPWLLVDNIYRLDEKIYKGSYSEIRAGINTKTGAKICAKIQSLKNTMQTLKIERKMYQRLQDATGIPSIFYYGPYGNFNVLIMQRLGPNLEQVFNLCKRQFSLKTVIYLAIQLITRIETIHRHGIVFRDIKPENFLLGLPPNTNLIYVIDFSLSKLYKDPVTDVHIKMKERNHFTGTVRYISLNGHKFMEQVRRDDLESIAYVLLYFLKQGQLPWSGFRGLSQKECHKMIFEHKSQIAIEILCHGFPNEFANFLRYARSLAFEDTPDYQHQQKMFVNLFQRENFLDDGLYDWSNRINATDQS